MKKIFLLFCFIFCIGCGFDSGACLKSVQDRYKDGEVYVINEYKFIVIDSEKNIRLVETNMITSPSISKDIIIRYACKSTSRLWRSIRI